MSGVRRRAIHKRIVGHRNYLYEKVKEAADILRPIYEADPKVREWFGHQGYGGIELTADEILKLKAPLKGNLE